MLVFLLLIFFSFVTLCPNNADIMKYPYWGGEFFLGENFLGVKKLWS